MKKLCLSLAFSALVFFSHAQNFNMQYRGEIDYPYSCASLWGYAQNGNEYALVGTYDGVSIVDVTDPDNPVDLFDVATEQSEWREIKTYSHYAYASTEDEFGGHLGMLIIDLSDLPNSYTQYYFKYTDPQGNVQQNGHTLWIDEQGRLFIFGGNYGSGGYTCFDLTADPLNPTFLGKYESHYIHDGMARGDTLWASEIYDGHLEVLDVSDPASAVSMAVWSTTSNFTHNSWPTSNDHYLFTTDEVNNSYLTSYDVSDLSNVTELDKVQSNPGSQVIIHNVHLYNDEFATVAYYKDGVVLFDVSHPDNMIEVGHYDTDPGESGGNYGGTWGVYPYLPSGNIIASDLSDAGAAGGKLTVLTPTYVPACWLQGHITDSATGLSLNNVSVQVLTTQNSVNSDLSGNYKTGNGVAGTYDVQFSKVGYGTKTISVDLESGVVDTLDVVLPPVVAFSYSGQVLESGTGNPVSGANVMLDGGTNGVTNVTTDANGNFNIASMYPGAYNCYAGKWSYRTKAELSTSLSVNSSPLVFYLDKGYYDDFLFNYNWVSQGGNSGNGKWVHDVPIGTSDNNGVYNPYFDVDNDYGTECFITGNGGGDPGTSDVDGTKVNLISPVFDLSNYGEPYINFYAWWVDSGPFGAPDDTMHITLSNGSTTVKLLDLLAGNSDANWDWHSFKVSNYITPTSNMTMKLSTVDYEGNANWIEGGLDVFEVEDSLSTGVPSSGNERNQLLSAPNPFSDESVISFSFNQQNFRMAKISIYNSVGQLLRSYPISMAQGNLHWGNDLPSGTYFITVKVNDEMMKMMPVVKE